MTIFDTTSSKAFLAPMSGVTNVAFRALCKAYGAGLTYTEFVSSAAIVRGNTKTLEAVRVDPLEKPVAIQLFGNSTTEVVEAAKLLEKDFDIIDINCGCPAWKVIKTGAGSELLKSPEKIEKLVKELVEAIDKPITVKIRIGINEQNINAIEVAKAIERAGAKAIAIHGRTQKQGYSGTANWDVIKQVVEAVSIPVIGNGDIDSPEKFKEMLEYSGVAGIMIGRAAMSNPFIFKQIEQYMKTGAYEQENKLKIFTDFMKYAEKYNIDEQTIKTHIMQFTKGIPNSTHVRGNLAGKTITEIKDAVMTFLKEFN